MTREELMEGALAEFTAHPFSEEELSAAYQVNPVLRRFLGCLLYNVNSNAKQGLLLVDLVSEEGRLNAIRQQGMAQGQYQQVEALFDQILEGMSNEELDVAAE